MKISVEQATERVQSALLGEEIHSLYLGDVWSLGFTVPESLLPHTYSLFLLAHEVVCSAEDRIKGLLARSEPDVLSGPNAEENPYPVKSLLLVSFMRRPVTDCSITSDGMLTLEFGHGRVVRIQSNVDIVDWQWFLGPTEGDPYSAKSIVACMWPGVFEGDDG
jgi:hypothetical protein